MDESEILARLAAQDAKIARLEAELAAASKKPVMVEGNVISARIKAVRLDMPVSTVRKHAQELGGRRRFWVWVFPDE